MTPMTQMQSDGDPRTYAIIGAAIEAHRQLGHGFLEAVYHDALAIELDTRAVPYRSEVELPVFYKGRPLRPFYRVDFVCFDDVIVEIKALRCLTGCEEAQIINYLKASRLTTGLLLNFGSPWLEHKRYVYSPSA